jgi:Na+-transporting NADH:ubiquinone oxidoreductase subunit E
MTEHLVSIFVTAAFLQNMALAYFLGMCSFLAVSRRVDTAIGLGIAVMFVLGLTCPLNQLIHEHLLRAGALAWLSPSLATVDLSFLNFLTFVGTIAAAVQVVEMVISRWFLRLQGALGVFLPLIAVNCAILGGSLFMVERRYDLPESVVFGLGAGFGFALAVVALAAIRERLAYSDVPAPLKGLPLTFIITGLMAIAFMSFAGVRL